MISDAEKYQFLKQHFHFESEQWGYTDDGIFIRVWDRKSRGLRDLDKFLEAVMTDEKKGLNK